MSSVKLWFWILACCSCVSVFAEQAVEGKEVLTASDVVEVVSESKEAVEAAVVEPNPVAVVDLLNHSLFTSLASEQLLPIQQELHTCIKRLSTASQPKVQPR